MGGMYYAALWLVATAALAITAYVVVRSGALGWFRTKREHFNWVRREIREDEDGEEEPRL